MKEILKTVYAITEMGVVALLIVASLAYAAYSIIGPSY